MNRADRRRKGREVNNNPKVVTTNNLRSLFSKLNSQDFLLIERVIENRVSNVLEESSYILDMIYSAKLSDLGFSWKETEKFNNDISKTFAEDSEKLKKIQRELGKDCEEKMAKISVEVENRIKELINAGGGRKEVIETILFEFPKLTKSMATNAYSRTNAELKKGQIKQEQSDDPEVEEAVEYIFEEEKEVKKTEVKPVVIEAEKEKAVQASVLNEKEEVEVKGLKVLEEKVVKSIKVKGENGTYEAETGKGVILSRENSSVCFQTEEQLDKWVSEFRKVFEMIKA